MDAQPIKITNEKTAFALARRAQRLAQPIVNKVIGAQLTVEITAIGNHETHLTRPCIVLAVHHTRPEGGLFNMIYQSAYIRDSRELQRRLDELELGVADRLRIMPHMRREVQS